MRGREPFFLGTIGAVIGIILAVVIFGGFGGPGQAGASASPTTLQGQSVAPSPTLLAVQSVTPSQSITAAPPSDPPVTEPPVTEPPVTAKPPPTPNTNPRIVSFETPTFEDCTNSSAGSVTLKWSVRNASGVTISIDGPGIYNSYPGLTREEKLPFGCSMTTLQHTYTITTIGGTGPAASITKTIKARPASIVSFTVSKPDCSGGETFVGINISFEIRAATGAELKRDDQVYSTYNTKATDDIVMYDCSQNDQEWRLTTTGGYGPEATKAIKVSKN